MASRPVNLKLSLFFFIVFFFFFFFSLQKVLSLPLFTDSRWIVDENGKRVKLACANWPSHLQPVVAEGLSKRPVDAISKKIVALGFNCVRFTWPLDLATNSTLANDVTVRQSFESLGLWDAISGFQTNNPAMIDLPLIQAFQMVVANLGSNGLMVVLDNHVTKPGWCCGNNDGNGFFGDRFFDPDEWISGLTTMATMFRTSSNVVAMSLRNELRGPRQSVNDWYRYMQRGAEAVHAANPDVLVILSGLSFDKDLSFLPKHSLSLTFSKKLVFEVHWYAFTDGNAWASGNPNQVCGRVSNNVRNNAGFLLQRGLPLFVSEFGIDQRGGNINDNRYFNCFIAWAADNDVDWAIWVLAGSYYLREGVAGYNEVYGVMDWSWVDIRNSTFMQKLSSLQSPLRGPGLGDTDPYNIIFHPVTALCVRKSASSQGLELGHCEGSEPWVYTAEKSIQIKGMEGTCLQAGRIGSPVTLGKWCSRWETISDSRMHLSTRGSSSTSLCLDVDSRNNKIIVNRCKCLSKDAKCDPMSQWFKIISTIRALSHEYHHQPSFWISELIDSNQKGFPWGGYFEAV